MKYKTPMKNNALLLLPFILAVAGCDMGRGNTTEADRISDISIPVSQIPFFGNIAEYNLLPGARTRSNDDETFVTLESLLDKTAAKEEPFKNMVFQQIPFLQNEDDYLVQVTDSTLEESGGYSVLKKFLVNVFQEQETSSYVVTMATSAGYAYNHPDFDYLTMPNYTGIVIFSTLQGEITEARTYSDGLAEETFMLTREQMESGEYESLQFITVYAPQAATRARDDEELYDTIQASVCTGKKNPPKGNRGAVTPPEITEDIGGGGGGDGGNSQGESGDGSEKDSEKNPKKEYVYELSAMAPCTMIVKGNGTHTADTYVDVDVYPPSVVSTETQNSLYFGMWSGDLKYYSTPQLRLKATQDVTATAYYNYKVPCVSEQKKVMNPLHEMQLAATTASGYYGGTFGWTRINEDGTKKYHQGIDILAEIGTPVYAMYDGEIIEIESGIPDKPNQLAWGNYIYYKAFVDGKELYIFYAHLQSGNAVGYNPRKHRIFHSRDTVYAGDLIGYTGRSGNAYSDTSVPNKHLHLGIKIGGMDQDWVDPEPYLNGQLPGQTQSSINSSDGKFTGIDCDRTKTGEFTKDDKYELNF